LLPDYESGGVKKMEKMEMSEQQETKQEFKVRFRIPQVELRTVFDFFKNAVNDVVLFHASMDGVRIAATSNDDSRLGIVYLNKSSMRNYEVTNNHTFALDLSLLRGTLLLIKDKQALLTFIQNNDRIIIASADGFTKEVFVEDTIVNVRVPEINYASGGVVDTDRLYRMARMAQDVNSTVKLTGDGNNLVISAERDTQKKIAVEVPISVKAGGYNGEQITVSSEFLLSAVTPLKEYSMMVRIANNKPLKINFKKPVLDGEIKGYIMIAPRME